MRTMMLMFYADADVYADADFMLMLMFTLMLMLTRMHILPGGSGLLLPVHPHLPHLPSCLPILHCRYVKCT